MTGKKTKYLWQAFSALALLGLIACDSQPKPANEQVVLDGTTIQVPLPQQLRVINAIDPAAVTAVVTINGVEIELQSTASGGQFTGQIAVPAQSSFAVVIEFYEMFAGQRLNLARAERVVTTAGGNTTLNLQSEDYDIDSFDLDGDSVSNLAERQFDTNPLDSSELPDLVEVEVFAALPVEAIAAGYSDYRIEASIGVESVTAAANNGPLSQLFTVARQDALTVNVRLIENTTGQNLIFGEQTRLVVNPPEFSQIVFSGTEYNFDADQDADGFSDLEELIAGTDLFSAPDTNLIPFSVVFEVPSEIADPDAAFAMLEINGSNVDLSRVENTYTATAMAVAGSAINIAVQINDTFQGEPVVLATFNGEAMPSSGGTLQLEGFTLQIDTDNDGVANFIELAQGSDPFNPPEPQCTPVTENVFATLTDDAFQQNRLFNNRTLQVQTNSRTTLIRYSHDESLGTVTAANLNLTVTTDEGNGLLSVFSVENFEWSETDISVELPVLGVPVGMQDNVWEEDVEYSFDLNPDAITGDFTLFIAQSNGNDVAFGSSGTDVPPTLELAVERCE